MLLKKLKINGKNVNSNDRVVRGGLFFVICLASGIFITFIGLTTVSFFFRISLNGFLQSLTTDVVVEAIKLSIFTSFSSLIIIIVLGTPIAYINARYQYLGKQLVDTLIDIPIVLPPAVAGLGLLMAFGRTGLLGQYFSIFGFDIAFTTLAVVLAEVFVSSPLYIRQAKTSFEDVNSQFEAAARTLGATPSSVFFRITVPIAKNGLVSGAILTWARALGEFGATIIFAGNFQGTTQTMPLAIYEALESNLDAAISLSIIFVTVSFIIIAIIKSLIGVTFLAATSDRL